MNPLRNRSGRRGAALVEFALILPLLMLFLLGSVEFAMIGHHKLSIVQGARAGAREASIGRPLEAIRAKVKGAAPNVQISDDQIQVEFNAAEDGSGEWLPVVDSASGTANAVPFGRLVRVRVVEWPHRLITGSFFSWLPGVQEDALPLNGQMVMRRE